MPGSLSMGSRRAKGSWVPKLVGVGVVGVVAAGGVAYLGLTHHQNAPRHGSRGSGGHPALSAKVVGQQTVGLIDFGPYDDRDNFSGDADDHPLMLQPTKTGLRFAVIPAPLLATGQPQWTADLMADGNEIFIYNPLGKCLAVAPGGKRPELARCASVQGQRWRPLLKATFFGQTFAAYANVQTGGCLTAPVQPTKMNKPSRPGVATLAACGPARTRSQEIAFWWTL